MRVHGVVVPHPAIDQGESGSSIGDWVHPDVIALERLHQRLGHAVAFRAFDRGEAGHQVERQGGLDRLVGSEDRSVIGEPLHGMRRADLTKRFSTQSTIMSRIISPEIPAVVATQLITSRSWQSRAKARRTISPFQQVNSSASEHQRQFEWIVATWP